MGVVNIHNNIISNNNARICIQNHRMPVDEDNDNDFPIYDINIHNNNIMNNELNVIKIIGATKAKIKYNNVSNNERNGIYIVFSSHCEISYNNITKNKQAGIILTDVDEEMIPTLMRNHRPIYRGNSIYCIIHNNNIIKQ
ncbi:hypothetical protein ALNOE001_19790 [Candidatus Methanobinarius endosymbioticus]|uniref:Uncharacterized protein n=1 Tax=Candidatus Methanobinarius endosymbioticus TaxID=2006182 RepID=A0A366M7V5_9EURY|nr:hypothetical protein ALNOE001_19790 [Candidatus Methanobinarius endosymbioticus]